MFASACRTRPSAVTMRAASRLSLVSPKRRPGEAVPAAQREAGDAHRRARARRHGHASARERALHVDQLRAGADRRAAAGHPHAPQLREVEHNAVAGARVAGVAVAAGAGHDADVEAVRPAHRRGHVRRALHVHDRIRAGGPRSGGCRRSPCCRAGRAPFPSPPPSALAAPASTRPTPRRGSRRRIAPPALPTRNWRRSSWAIRSFQQTPAHGLRHRRRSLRHAELLVDVLKVRLHRRGAEVQRRGRSAAR